MKKLILMLLCCISFLANAQDTIYVSSRNSVHYKEFIDSATKFNNYISKLKEYRAKYSYEYMIEKNTIHKFGNEEESYCLCGSNNEDAFVYLTKVKRPYVTVGLIPQPKTYIKYVRDTIVKNKFIHKTDTFQLVKWDTIYVTTLLVSESQDSIGSLDSIDKVKFTTLDNRVHMFNDLAHKGEPYIEKRFYDKEGKLVRKAKLDPVTLTEIIDYGRPE